MTLVDFQKLDNITEFWQFSRKVGTEGEQGLATAVLQDHYNGSTSSLRVAD